MFWEGWEASMDNLKPFTALTLLWIEIHCNRCESMLTTAVILNKGAGTNLSVPLYKPLWLFDAHNTVSKWFLSTPCICAYTLSRSVYSGEYRLSIRLIANNYFSKIASSPSPECPKGQTAQIFHLKLEIKDLDIREIHSSLVYFKFIWLVIVLVTDTGWGPSCSLFFSKWTGWMTDWITVPSAWAAV